MITKKKIFGSALAVPISFMVSYILASLFSDNSVVYIDFFSRKPSFYIWFFLLLAVTLALSYALIFTKFRQKAYAFFDIFEGKSKLEPLAILLAALIAFLFFNIAYDGPIDDYVPHTEFALAFDWSSLGHSLYVLPHPLWHTVVSLAVKVFYFSPMCACAISTALFCTLTFIFTRAIVINYVNPHNYIYTCICDIVAAMLMFMQPLYIKQFNDHQIVGQGSPFMLHNPTNLTVQPFALICAFLFLDILKKKIDLKTEPSSTDFLRLSVFSLISSFAKPSFLQVFLPAVCILLLVWLIKNKFSEFKFCLKLAFTFTPAIINILRVMIIEFFLPTSTDSGGIALDFFSVWAAHSPFVPFSILLGAGYCLIYLCLKNKHVSNPLTSQVILLCWVVGILEFGLLMETGYRKYHGNFSWGYCISLSLMYVFVTAELLANTLKKPFTIKNIGIPEILTLMLLLVQFVQGVIYFIGII